MSALATPSVSLDLDALHNGYLSLLPCIETHARIYFRHLQCGDRREDAVQETLALAWKWFVRLAEKGKDASCFASTLAHLAARAVKCGRRLTGKERANDVMSPVAQRRHGFQVESLPTSTRNSMEDVYSKPRGQQEMDALEERLRDNTRTPVDDAAGFRIDFPEWLCRWSDRDRRIIDDMIRDERTRDLARKFGVSPARIAQLRRAYHTDWQRFHGEVAANELVTGAA
jgi:hypothetical protein